MYGYFENGASYVSTYFYGGLWGANNAGCLVTQTTSVYVGGNPVLEAPNNVGITGNILQPGFGGTHEWLIGGNNFGNFFVSDYLLQDEWNGFMYNTCNLQIS